MKPYATPAKLESIDGEDVQLDIAPSTNVFSCCRLYDPAQLSHSDPSPGARYQGLLIPDCPGALNDLAHSGSLHRILTHFISHQSKHETIVYVVIYDVIYDVEACLCAEPVCAVGQGVSALCCATEGQKWIFSGYSLTGVCLPGVTKK